MSVVHATCQTPLEWRGDDGATHYCPTCDETLDLTGVEI